MPHFRPLKKGGREDKFGELATLSLGAQDWIDYPDERRAPFLPATPGNGLTSYL